MLIEASKYIAENSGADWSDVKRTLERFFGLTKNDYLRTKGISLLTTPIAAWLVVKIKNPMDDSVVLGWHRDSCMYGSDHP